MTLDSNLAGHETAPETGTITAEDVRQFAEAVGDASPIHTDPEAARAAGYERIPAPPTFVTRFRVPFEEAGLDVRRMQVLHGEQEYTYERPVYVGDTLNVRHRIASIRQSRGGLAIMTIEQLGDTPDGQRVVTGSSTVLVREAEPGASAPAAGGGAGAAKAAKVPQGDPIPPISKHVTQGQIDAYADVSGDHNPIHINPEAARAVGLDGTIAHGMLSMAFVAQLLTAWLANDSIPHGWVKRLRVRFQSMVRPGDTLSVRAVRGERGEDTQRMEVWIDNQKGERILTGDADVAFFQG